MSVTVTLIGKNKLSGPFGKGSRSIAGMGKAIVGLGLKFAKFGALAGIAIAGVSVKLAVDFEKGLREVGTLMGGLTDNQMKAMSKELRTIAVSSGQAINTLVKAKYDIVSAGFVNAADSAKLLNASVILATGGVTSVANAADLLTTTLNAYNLTARESINVSDKLFTIVRLGKTTMDELGGSMGRVVAIAGQAGISLDEVGAAVATLTAQGLDTARAITSLQGAIVQILKPTEIMKGIIEKLGFATGDAMLKQIGFAGSLKLIKAQADKASLPLSEVFGSIEALQAVLPLTGTAAAGFARNLREMEKSSGAAQKALEEMEKSASFQLGRVKQAFNSVAITIGEKFLPAIADAAEAIADFMSSDTINQFGNLKDAQIALGVAQAELAKKSDALGQAMRAGAPTTSLIAAYAEQETLVAELVTVVDDLNVKYGILSGLGALPFDLDPQLAANLLEYHDQVKSLTPSLKNLNEAQALSVNLFDALARSMARLPQLDIPTAPSFIPPPPPSVPETEGLGKRLANLVALHKDELKVIGAFGQAAGKLYSALADKRTAAIRQGLQTDLQEQQSAFNTEIAIISNKNTIDGQLTQEGFNLIAEATKAHNEKVEQLNNTAREKEKAALKALKPIKLAQAVSNIALGITGALGSPPFGIFSLVTAGLIGAAGAIQLAAIQASPFQFGGRVSGLPSGTDTVPALLSPGEIVSTTAAANLFGPEITRMNQIAEGGGASGGGDTFIINAVDAQSFERMLKRNGPALGRAIRQATRDRNLQITDLPHG